jgi:cell division protein FtsB
MAKAEATRGTDRWLLLPLLLLLFAIVFVPMRVLEEQGLPRYRKLRAELEQTRQQSARLRREVVALEEHVGRLRHDPGALERIARDEIGMLRKDELVFRFDD